MNRRNDEFNANDYIGIDKNEYYDYVENGWHFPDIKVEWADVYPTYWCKVKTREDFRNIVYKD